MMRRKLAVTVIGGLLQLVPVIVGAVQTDRLDALPEVVATVDGHPVTRAEIKSLLSANDLPADDHALLRKVRQAADTRIYLFIIDRMLAEAEIVPDAAGALAYLRELEALLPHGIPGMGKREFEAMAAQPKIQLNAALHRYFTARNPEAIAVSEQEVENAYRLNQERFLLPEELDLAVLQIPKTRENARELADGARARLLQGEEFNRVAAELNPNGVTLPSAALLEALKSSGRELQLNNITPVFEVEDHWVLVKLRGKRPAHFVPPELAAPYLRRQLEAEKVGRALEAELREELAKLPIQYFLNLNPKQENKP